MLTPHFSSMQGSLATIGLSKHRWVSSGNGRAYSEANWPNVYFGHEVTFHDVSSHVGKKGKMICPAINSFPK